ncbi:Glycosyltransferase 25 family member [Schistosoma japonicum]|nr:Glycosyltransferase 25 family member [Schistosoma japonicum]
MTKKRHSQQHKAEKSTNPNNKLPKFTSHNISSKQSNNIEKNTEQKQLKIYITKLIMKKRTVLSTCLLITICFYVCFVLINCKISTNQMNSNENVFNESLINSIHVTLNNNNNEINDNEQLTNEYNTQFKQNSNYLMPTLCIGVLIRNKAHTLPYFLNGLEQQQYPTKRIILIFYVDNTIDTSELILNAWIQCNQKKYHKIILEVDKSNTSQLEYENVNKMWTVNHYQHVIKLRQKLLDKARDLWANFYFSIDADVILMNSLTIEHLINVMHPSQSNNNNNNNDNNNNNTMNKNIIILAPLINCTTSEYYSNFWGAMSEEGYYVRSEHYFDLLKRHIQGVYPVAMVHSIFLVNLQYYQSELIGYNPALTNYDGPIDDIIIFSRSVQRAGIDFYLDNTQFYGYFPSPVDEQDLGLYSDDLNNAWLLREQDLFVHLRLQAIIDQEDKHRVLPSECLTNIVESQLTKLNKINFNEIYCINLLRRPDRRQKMEYMFQQLGINVKYYDAIDGKDLTITQLNQLEIQQLPGYADPYHNRSLKLGEIGCFLSHYNIWNEMITNGYNRILILEDDLRFAPAFIRNLNKIIKEADENVINWDLLYIGRKRMSKSEKRVPNTTSLAYPDYTYWTLGYVLNRSGAIKLINQKPLQKLIAVDEYLPIMFNKHPRKDWLIKFEPRDLIALSAEPLLVEPQRYTGEELYISDTEDSDIFHII